MHPSFLQRIRVPRSKGSLRGELPIVRVPYSRSFHFRQHFAQEGSPPPGPPRVASRHLAPWLGFGEQGFPKYAPQFSSEKTCPRAGTARLRQPKRRSSPKSVGGSFCRTAWETDRRTTPRWTRNAHPYFHISFSYSPNICSRPPRSRSVAGPAERRQPSPRALARFCGVRVPRSKGSLRGARVGVGWLRAAAAGGGGVGPVSLTQQMCQSVKIWTCIPDPSRCRSSVSFPGGSAE